MHQSPVVLVLAGATTAVASCAPSIPVSFDSPEPGARNTAIVRAAAARKPDDVPNLVRMLDSDDPVTRMLAIRALERIEGTTLGFDPCAPDWERSQSIEQWRERVQRFRAPSGPSPGRKDGAS